MIETSKKMHQSTNIMQRKEYEVQLFVIYRCPIVIRGTTRPILCLRNVNLSYFNQPIQKALFICLGWRLFFSARFIYWHRVLEFLLPFLVHGRFLVFTVTRERFILAFVFPRCIDTNLHYLFSVPRAFIPPTYVAEFPPPHSTVIIININKKHLYLFLRE